ncbi:hypothetical protein PROVRUST_06131 [Providencia rustigianii DSM 4541]|uniref:Uncharacterized protein n=1 Tax=Providencia rustigianii DSM 4541 TaxID=500637 RepID=D1P1Q9_9GAMM|nr:hypothetical protein PROVRUST_06131 [Providencia rustigianii DSM 4541]
MELLGKAKIKKKAKTEAKSKDRSENGSKKSTSEEVQRYWTNRMKMSN